MFVSVFKHMVSISGIKMANTWLTFFLTFGGDGLSRGRWAGREDPGRMRESVRGDGGAFDNPRLPGGERRGSRKQGKTPPCPFPACDQPGTSLPPRFRCPNCPSSPSPPPWQRWGGRLTLEGASLSAAQNWSSWVLKGSLGQSEGPEKAASLMPRRPWAAPQPSDSRRPQPGEPPLDTCLGTKDCFPSRSEAVAWGGVPRNAAGQGLHRPPPQKTI